MSDRDAPQFFVTVFQEGLTGSKRIGVDVDVKIISLVFEDAEKMHKLKLSVDNFNLEHFDSPTFARGNIIEFSYGYPGNMSPMREAVITKITGGIVLTVEALGKEYLMNKVLKVRRFEQMTRSEIAAQIATENGFSASLQTIDATSVRIPVVLQARQTDLGLLRALATKEGFEVYTDATGFHFHKRDLTQRPRRTFTYYTSQKGDLLGFPSIEIDVTAKPGAVTAKGRDPLAKKDIKETADNASTKNRPALGSVLEVVDVQTAQTSLQTNTATETTTSTTATSAADAKAQVAGAYTKSQMGAVKFKVPAVGDPRVEAKTLCTFDGLGAKLSGNYLVSKVTHKLASNGGYTMDMECRRDGSGSGGGVGAVPATAGKTNDTAAPTGTGQQLKAVEVVDERSAQTHLEYK